MGFSEWETLQEIKSYKAWPQKIVSLREVEHLREHVPCHHTQDQKQDSYVSQAIFLLPKKLDGLQCIVHYTCSQSSDLTLMESRNKWDHARLWYHICNVVLQFCSEEVELLIHEWMK